MKRIIEQESPTQMEWDTWVYFLKAYKVVVDSIDKELRSQAPVSLVEFELIHLVDKAGGRLRFIDLAKLTLLSQSRISRQVDALQEKGYLFREITASDRRATFAVLTPKGEAVHALAIGPFAAALRKDLVNLVPDQFRKTLNDIMKGLLQEPDFREKATEIVEQAQKVNLKLKLRSKSGRAMVGRTRRAS